MQTQHANNINLYLYMDIFSRRQTDDICRIFPQKISFRISCIIRMKCQSVFSLKKKKKKNSNKKKYFKISSAKSFTQHAKR